MSDKPLGHEDRVKPGARGTVVEICDAPWLVADYVPFLEPVWGRLYDQNQIEGSYDLKDLCFAAARLLLVNYDLEPDEVADLTLAAPTEQLVKAVEAALFPERNPIRWDEWAEAALVANGIDPAAVPGHLRHIVLHHLVQSGRAVAAGSVVDSISARAQFAALGIDPRVLAG